MSINLDALEPQIREILTAPGIDLSTISAKRVRKQLLEVDTSLTADSLKDNKEKIDELIANIYEQVSAEASRGGSDEGESGSSGKPKRKRAKVEDMDVDDGEEQGEEEDDDETPPPKAKKGRKNKAITDEELARQLSEEINSRSRSSRATSTRGTRGRGGAKRGGKRGAKSAATVDSDGEGAGEEGEVKKKRRGGGFTKEYVLSEPLAAVIHQEKLSRPQVVKQLWDYIKSNNLQNPDYKKEILCDEKLKAVFNVDKIDMFKMNKVLGQHLSAPEPES
ncbi:hypothetical protein IEO21_02004 [Rhodonia placenta]|uniref:DM2 domain-containing protein n=1 Tax=Rhodonia placenta TaxID=104341 RepID=A0A8H7U4X4_9APHY|nr:hypothetical protein IEO21_02004 [Postia placenta]